MNQAKIKKEFSILKRRKQLSYLDNAATSLTPDSVVLTMNEYYKSYNSNVHRGVYRLAQEADKNYEGARKKVADFIGAQPYEVIFTSGATHGLNIVAAGLAKNLKPGDVVVLSRMEHHANLVPWQEASKKYGFKIKFIELNDRQELDLTSAESVIDSNCKIVSLIWVSNTLGAVNPVEKIIALAKKAGAVTMIDAAQAIAHLPINVKKLDCDFLVFSGHKMYGPTGIGILYGKKTLLEKMEPFSFGGDMISSVSYESASWNELPYKFEAGTPNIAGAIGLGAAVDYVKKISYKSIAVHEKSLTAYALKELSKIKGIKIIGQAKNRIGVISFTVDNIHPHDLATILDSANVAVRAGHHCTMPLMKLLGVKATARVSFAVYNDKNDVKKLIAGIKKALKIFSR